jgi:branched-chain amino acid aminotransferase
MSMVILIDGDVVADARISVLDRGLLYGDGLFEVFPSWADVEPHLDRLYASAAALHMHVIERDALRAQIDRVRGTNQRIRVIVTRGPGAIGKRFAAVWGGHTIVIAEEIRDQPTAVSVALVDWPLPRRKMPAHKTLAYFDHALARELAADAGADEALRCDSDGNVAECATANLFIVRNNVVITPPLAGILPGVTRARVLVWCANNQIATSESTIAPGALYAADELFATSAVRGVVAITQLDGQPRPFGALTARIAAAINAPAAI